MAASLQWDTNAHPDSYGHSHGNGNHNRNTHRYANCHSNGDTYCHCNCNSYSHSNGDVRDICDSDSNNDSDGNRQERTEWHNIIVWGKQGEHCAQYLKKGRGAHVEGHLQQRTWTTPEGQKRSKLEVVAERVQFLGDGRGPRAAPAPDADADPPARVPEADAPAPSDDVVPF